MEALAGKVGRRGTIVLPAKLRRRLGIEERSFVVAEERETEIVGKYGCSQWSSPKARTLAHRP